MHFPDRKAVFYVCGRVESRAGNLAIALADPSGMLPKPCEAGFCGIGWVTVDFTKSEIQQTGRAAGAAIQKVPLQVFVRIPDGSVATFFRTVKEELLIIDMKVVSEGCSRMPGCEAP